MTPRVLTATFTDRLVIEALELEALVTGRTVEGVVEAMLEKVRHTDSPRTLQSDAVTGKVARLVGEKYSDRDIAILLGISETSVARKRDSVGLPKNRVRDTRTRKTPSTLGRTEP